MNPLALLTVLWCSVELGIIFFGTFLSSEIVCLLSFMLLMIVYKRLPSQNGFNCIP